MTARKKLYPQRPKAIAKAKWMYECSGISAKDDEASVNRGLDGSESYL